MAPSKLNAHQSCVEVPMDCCQTIHNITCNCCSRLFELDLLQKKKINENNSWKGISPCEGCRISTYIPPWFAAGIPAGLCLTAVAPTPSKEHLLPTSVWAPSLPGTLARSLLTSASCSGDSQAEVGRRLFLVAAPCKRQLLSRAFFPNWLLGGQHEYIACLGQKKSGTSLASL